MFKLTVNGSATEVDVDGNTPLLWVIRDHLRLTGTKFGCGVGLCGACTAHIDGNPVRTCITPVKVAADKAITTIEGISDGGPHPLQVTWANNSVPQCGYCQSGQIMSASALLASNKTPTDADIDQAMSGNICRCGTYNRIRKAIHEAADMIAAGPVSQQVEG